MRTINQAGDFAQGDAVNYPIEVKRRYREAGLWRDRTISQEFAASAELHRDSLALVTSEASWTYADLLHLSNNIAAGLLREGMTPGERVILQISNSAQAVAAWYGILKAGLVPVCTLAIHREHEIGQIGRKTKASAHLVQADFSGYDLLDLAGRMKAEIPSMRSIWTIGDLPDSLDQSVLRIEDSLGREASAEELRQLDALQQGINLDHPAVLQLSGGTTGTPKVIPRLHPEYWYNGLAAAQWWGLGADSKLAFGLPIVHNAGVANALFGAHATGATLLLATAQTDELLPLMANHGATWLMSPPGVMRDYLDDSRFDVAFREVATCVLTAAPVPRPLFDEIQTRGVRVAQAFGMTEGLFLFTPRDASDELRATTIGVPISPLDEVRLLGPGSEDVVVEGEVGELCARGPYTIRGYLEEPERNTEVFTEDGFYRAGDLATKVHIDGQPAYILSGRTKDLINRGGEKISAEEIENLLLRHPSVVEVALVAMPDPRLGERACAFVVVREGDEYPTVATFRTFLDGLGVAKFKWPEKVMVVPTLPRTNIGKLVKTQLRRMAATDTA